MKTETIEKRIKEFRFWKFVNIGIAFGLGIIAGFFGVQGDYSRMFDLHTNIVMNMLSLFFSSIYWGCGWMEQMYKDMKEGKE